jgi:hypothetical protein
MAARRFGASVRIEDPTHATPVDIDYRNADLDAAMFKLTATIASTLDVAHDMVGDRGRPVGRSRREYKLSHDAAEAALRVMVAEGRLAMSYGAGAPKRYLEKLEQSRAALAEVNDERAALDAEYDRRPWKRYILVAGGHLHSGYWCLGGTIRPTTVRNWWPDLSGMDFDAAMKNLGDHAHTLCTHCFPNAPVLPAPVDDKCPGSRQSGKPGTWVRSYPNGTAECTACGKRQTLTPNRNIRAHKPPTK